MSTRNVGIRIAVLSWIMVCAAWSAGHAGNNAVFRDCSLLTAPIDADFLHLSGVVVHPDGSLTVAPSQDSLELTASESFDPFDNAGHVTLTATISSPGIPDQTVSGSGTDFVILQLPLNHAVSGRVYTISWNATFDNGQHMCPSAITLANTPMDPHPFVVTASFH